MPENAQTPQRRVHALLGALTECQTRPLTETLKKLWHMILIFSIDKKPDLLKTRGYKTKEIFCKTTQTYFHSVSAAHKQ